MSFVTADLCIISLGFFAIRFATLECVFATVYFCHCCCNKQLTYLYEVGIIKYKWHVYSRDQICLTYRLSNFRCVV